MTSRAEKPKVLLVDDDHNFASDCRTWLAREGFCTQAVGVGQAAIQRYRLYRPYDAVILDLHMPKVDGFQVLREIKRADARAKVAVLTGDGSARDNAVALGADAFVVKPVGRETVCKLVRTLVNNANNSTKEVQAGALIDETEEF